MLQKVFEKVGTHILFSIKIFWKSRRLWNNVGKYGTARLATDDTHAICLLDN